MIWAPSWCPMAFRGPQFAYPVIWMSWGVWCTLIASKVPPFVRPFPCTLRIRSIVFEFPSPWQLP